LKSRPSVLTQARSRPCYVVDQIMQQSGATDVHILIENLNKF